MKALAAVQICEKKIKRKCEDNETSEKIQRTNDVITECSHSGFISIDNDNKFEADTITNISNFYDVALM